MTTEATADYYALLGVEPEADAATLRRAFRRLALQWHPDRAGAEATEKFQTIASAYAVLSEPLARAAYDRRRAPKTKPAVAANEVRTAAGTVPAPTRRAPGVMLFRLTGQLNTLLATGAAQIAEDGAIELILNDQETEQGGMITVNLRVPVRCAACEGGSPSCRRCHGAGTTEELFSAWLAVPPDAADGTPLVPSALLPGMAAPVIFRARRREAVLRMRAR